MNGQVGQGAAKGAGICGIILFVCGIASAITGFIWIGINGNGGYGLWCGIFLIISGILGVLTWWKQNKGVLVGFLVLTIITIIVASIQAIVSGILYTVIKVFADPDKCVKSFDQCRCNGGVTYQASFCDDWPTLVNSLLAITIFSVIGAIVSFVGSIFGCIGCCSSTQQQPGTVIVQQPYVANPGYAPQPAGVAYAPQGGGPPPQYAVKQ